MDKKNSKSILDNKIWTAVISVLIGFGLWFYVVTTNSTGFENTFYNVPVNLQNESLLAERGLMIVENDVPDVDLKLAGNRTDINNLSSSNITVTADLASIWEPGTVTLEYKISFPGNVSQTAVSVQERSPSRVTLKIEQRLTKAVPVEIQYQGNVPEGYLADKDNIQLETSELMITGPKSVLDQITKAQILVDLEDQNQTLGGQFPFTLCDAENQPVDVALVSVPVEDIGLMVRILRVKTIPLTVTLEAGGGATVNTTEVKVDPEMIRVSGPDALLEGMESLNLGTIRLAEIAKNQTVTLPITLPEGVNNETGVTEASVSLRFIALTTKVFHVSNIQVVNVPEGLEVDGLTQALDVQLRGPKELMNTLTENDFTVTVDFAGEAAGEVKKNVVITFGDKFSEVGAIGSYHVSATLRTATEEDN